MRDGLTQE